MVVYEYICTVMKTGYNMETKRLKMRGQIKKLFIAPTFS